jgi:integrase
MSGSRAKITRQSVKKLHRGMWITDTALPGFTARRPNKLVLYGLKMRINGRQRFLSIGTEAEFTPDQARHLAEKLRGDVRRGADPASERDQRKAALSLDEAADRFLAEHVRPKLRSSTVRHYEETIRQLIRPALGTARIDTITRGDVAMLHNRLKSTPYQANRALAILSSLMAWAETVALRHGNPCLGLRRYREQPRQRFLSVAELARLSVALDALEADGMINPFFAAGIRLLRLSGARKSEIFKARWEWVDFERGLLVLPDSKTGGKSITLSEAALSILRSLPRYADNPYIIPSAKSGLPFVGLHKLWAKVIRKAGLHAVRIHDLRHSFASVAVARGAPLYTVGNLLGHANPSTTARYAHLGDDPRRAVMTAVADALRVENQDHLKEHSND